MRSSHDVLTLAGLSHIKHPWFDGADAASRLYAQALAEAELLFDVALAGGLPLVAPMAYTIACHNVAEAKRRAGDRAAAHSLKRHAVEKLIGTVESSADPLALRVNCVRHLRHALAFLAENLAEDETENRAEFDRLIARYGAIINELARVEAHVISERDSFEPGVSRLPRQGRLN